MYTILWELLLDLTTCGFFRFLLLKDPNKCSFIKFQYFYMWFINAGFCGRVETTSAFFLLIIYWLFV